ncbi:MAG: 3-isopropylmalate dehydrogenase [Eubacteriales bacterium]|nr:3-isopropylmalate dehydrogenase [Clostridia bacterium]MDD3074630.1 3-isopropylmalate dehydrogenase [Eubacteriales bacterium]
MFRLACLPGDGIGQEVTTQALRVLAALKIKYNLDYTYRTGLIGGSAIDETGEPFPRETKELVAQSDAVFLGAVGGLKWDGPEKKVRPEQGLLAIRKELRLYANLRPVKCWPQLMEQAPFKKERIAEVDLLIVRELTGGAYFGARGTETIAGETRAFDTIAYSDKEIRRLVKIAFELARQRRKKVTSVDKANILDTSRLWRKIVLEEAVNYPDISLNHLYVDNCAMQLCLNPSQFDVLVTENTFGDILSDQASVLGGSLGMLPSASLGEGPALYEPVHGSAPDIAGQDLANPLAAILSVAMMLRLSWQQPEAAIAVERAVERVLNRGLRTADLWLPNYIRVGTGAMTDAVIAELS